MSDLQRYPYKDLALKVAALEWAADAASDGLERLNWVDATIDPEAEPFQVTTTKEGRKYRHRPYAFFLPRVMANAAMSAQQRNEPTVLEALQYVFANMEWLVAARGYYWSPLSPIPKLLAILTEAFGIGPEIHRNDREVLSRLVARLPSWYPRSGSPASAQRLLEETVGQKLDISIAHINKQGAEPAYPGIENEVFSSRDSKWWAQRANKKSKMKLRINDGMLLFQRPKEQTYPLVREDVLIGWSPGKKFPTNLLRLLPMWISVRIVLQKGRGQALLGKSGKSGGIK